MEKKNPKLELLENKIRKIVKEEMSVANMTTSIIGEKIHKALRTKFSNTQIGEIWRIIAPIIAETLS